MRHRFKAFAWLLAMPLIVPALGRAQLVETTIAPAGELNWSATAGRTVGTNSTVLQAEAGWPGIGFTYLKGVDERTDLGLHVGFNYALEGTTNTTAGLNLAIPYRHTLGTVADAVVAFETMPGLSFYGNNGGVLVGVGGPVGMVAGFKVDPRLTLDVAAGVPMLISFTHPAGFLFGPQFGGGGEYLIDRNVAVTARLRIGPEFAVNSTGTGSQASFQTLIGLAYNTR